MSFYSTKNALFLLFVKLKHGCADKQTEASHVINWSNGIWIGAYFTVMALCWINSLTMFINESRFADSWDDLQSVFEDY